MKRSAISTLILVTVLLLGLAFSRPVLAAQTEVVFKNDQQKAVIELSSDDLFENFKGVMPGQSLTQDIILRNETSRKLRVFIRGKAMGEAERAFLQHASLQGRVNGRLIFDYKGPATDLSRESVLAVLPARSSAVMTVSLSTPISLGNEFQSTSYVYGWLFRAEDDLVDSDQDNKPPATGATLHYLLLPLPFILAGAFFLLLLVWKRRRRDQA